MKRVDNWPGHLAAFVEDKRDVPFKWGRNDCCLFACDWLLILVGWDPAGAEGLDLRGTYKTKRDADRILKVHGGVEGIASKVCREMNWPECSALMASRGDLVLTDGCIGVCVGSKCVFPSKTGILFKLTGEAQRAWRIA